MAEDDVASVRAEIKTWEKSFKEKHGRNPTVDDIRDNSPIARKYKLYKKLSKAAPDKSALSRASSSKRTSTPPPKPERASSVLSKSRPLETNVPLSSFNPFSPQKNKGKHKDLPTTTSPAKQHPLSSNPFTTPSKSKPKPRIRESSPSPRGSDSNGTSILFAPSNLPPEPLTAVTRARKRLRGEPVSPSPDKRRRVLSHQYTSGRGSDASDSEDDVAAGNSSFIADSPAKGSTGFRSLFEDPSGSTKVKVALTRAKSTSASAGLFGPIRGNSVSLEDDLDSVLGPPPTKSKYTNGKSLSSRLLPRKDDLYTTTTEPAQTLPKPAQSKEETTSNVRVSGKRVFPADSDNESEAKPSSWGIPLIPPSPRGETSQRSANIFTKGKGKAPARKKTKLEDDEDMDSLSDDVKVLPVIPRSRSTRAGDADGEESDLDPESDPILWHNRRVKESLILGKEEHATGTLEVDLPDKLKHVLALSSSDSKVRDVQEEHVVESLMYGRRLLHYEPSKGGEIWDVGDVEIGQNGDDETRRGNVDDEEDWEGEPIPWEVGEL